MIRYWIEKIKKMIQNCDNQYENKHIFIYKIIHIEFKKKLKNTGYRFWKYWETSNEFFIKIAKNIILPQKLKKNI